VRKIETFLLCGVLLSLTATAAPAAVDADYERGLVERVATAFAHEQPPSDLLASGYPSQRCGTPIMMEIKRVWPDLSDDARRAITASVQTDRPDLPEYYDTPDGLFRIHYSRTGPDSVDMDYGVGEGNVPVYVLNCADLLEDVVAKEIDELGFRFPVSDSLFDPTGDRRYDIYFQREDLGDNYYGWTVPDGLVEEPGEPSPWMASWIVLHGDYGVFPPYSMLPFYAMAVTLAHEFHHACQWMYDAYEAEWRDGSEYPWFLELSATAMEEIVFDYVNDYYAYLPAFLHYPWVSLRYFTTASFHPYASAIWMLYLVQKFDDESIVRRIWEECREKPGFNTFEAFETVLQERGSSFAEAWAEFLVWNYFTGERGVEWSYEEGERYTSIPVEQIPVYDTFPITDSTRVLGFPRRVDELGAQYLTFIPVLTDTTASPLRLQLTALDGFEEWMVVTAGLSGAVKPTIRYARDILNPVEEPDWEESEELLVIITPFKSNPQESAFHDKLGYKYEVADTISRSAAGTALLKVFPNPLILDPASGDSLSVVVARETEVEASMAIFTVDGRLIVGGSGESDNVNGNRLYAPAKARDVRLVWNGRSSAGKTVASGIYLGLVRIGDKMEVTKIAVRNRGE